MTPLQVTRDMSQSPSNSSEWSNPDMENHPPLGSPSSTSGAQSAGRILYCRKCEGHGEKVVLKNHTPNCPYILCTCKSCERLNQKRLKSFSKRNKDKLKLAAELCEKRRQERESRSSGMSSRKISSSSTATTSSSIEVEMDSDSSPTRTGIESRSMSLGAMTVMSYDIWKAKCAADKKKMDDERKASLASQTIPSVAESDDDLKPISRKRANTTICPMEPYRDIPKISPPNVKEKKGRYILLPTIPAMKVFVDDETGENTGNAMSVSATSATSDVANTTSATSSVASSTSILPTTSTPASVPITAVASSTTIPSIPATATPMLTVSSFPTVTTGMGFMSTQPTVSQVPISSMTTAAASMTVPATGITAPFMLNQSQLGRPNVNMNIQQPTSTAPMMSTDQLVSLLNPQILLQTSLLQQQQQQAQQQQQQQQNACLQQLLSLLTGNQANHLAHPQQAPAPTQVPVPMPGQPDILALLRSQQQMHQASQQHPLYITTQHDQMSLTSSASDDLLKTLLAMRQQPIFSNTV
ncbi:unnamed protein product [Auanema sp. JU1783]|nr:unnamed protein product [Auanema sp. JU1783]